MNIYDFTLPSSDGKAVPMSDYKGKVLLIVNTASKCGFTPQYDELQELYDKYRNQGFEVLAFPCNQFMHQEPGNDKEIANFCTINFGITFPVFAKIDVKGTDAHPLYKYLTSNTSGVFTSAVKWNFTKFLIDSTGRIAGRFSPTTPPSKLKNQIEKLL